MTIMPESKNCGELASSGEERGHGVPMGREAVEIKWFPWPKKGNIDEMFHQCENVTEADWDALKQHIKEHGYKFGGVYHQSTEHSGVPYIKGKLPFFCSFRAWGGLMAEIWGGDYTMYAWEYAVEGGNTPPDDEDYPLDV